VIRIPYVDLLGSIFRSSNGYPQAKCRICPKPIVLRISKSANPWAKIWTKPTTHIPKSADIHSKPDPLPSLVKIKLWHTSTPPASMFCFFSPQKTTPPSRNIRSWRVQTQETTVRGNDLHTPYFTLPTNSPPTHQASFSFVLSFQNLIFWYKIWRPYIIFWDGRSMYFIESYHVLQGRRWPGAKWAIAHGPPKDQATRRPSSAQQSLSKKVMQCSVQSITRAACSINLRTHTQMAQLIPKLSCMQSILFLHLFYQNNPDHTTKYRSFLLKKHMRNKDCIGKNYSPTMRCLDTCKKINKCTDCSNCARGICINDRLIIFKKSRGLNVSSKINFSISIWTSLFNIL
jgi:hypothetical protein